MTIYYTTPVIRCNTITERDSLSPYTGLQCWVEDDLKFYRWTGSAWVDNTGGGPGGGISLSDVTQQLEVQ